MMIFPVAATLILFLGFQFFPVADAQSEKLPGYFWSMVMHQTRQYGKNGRIYFKMMASQSQQ